MSKLININSDWKFIKDDVGAENAPMSVGEMVNLPHTWNGDDGQDGGDDYVRGACPADSVCYSFYPIDVHQGADRVGIPGRQDRLQQLRTVCGWDRTLQQRWCRLSEPEK